MWTLPILSMGVFVAVWQMTRPPNTVTPLDLFCVFMLMQYGPHIILFTSHMPLSSYAGSSAFASFYVGLALAYVSISCAILVAPYVFPIPPMSERMTTVSAWPANRSRWPFIAVTALAVAYIIVFLIVDGPGLPRLSENIRYFVGKSYYSYTELRRIVFAETAYEKLAGRLRFSATAVLFALIIAVGIRSKIKWYFTAGIAFLLFAVCASHMSKFSALYYGLLGGWIVALCRTQAHIVILRVKSLLITLTALLLAFIMLGLLYRMQYADAMAGGYFGLDDIARLLLYRPFFAVGDALHLWFETFPPYLGLSSVGLFEPIFSIEFIDPTVLVPGNVLGSDMTTMQTGFIGSGYAAFGYIGIAVYSVLVGFVVWTITVVPFVFLSGVLRVVAIAVLSLNTYFLTTRQLHTALMSGGVLSGLMLLGGLTVGLWLLRFIGGDRLVGRAGYSYRHP